MGGSPKKGDGMFASHVSRRCFFWASVVFCALWFTPLKIQATPPTSATARCQVILSYEGVCGYYRPNNCFSRPGFDYWGNSQHRHIWDAYQDLSVWIGGLLGGRRLLPIRRYY